MKFSQRHGYTDLKSIIQIESIDTELKNAIWDGLKLYYFDELKSDTLRIKSLIMHLWNKFFKIPIDTIPEYHTQIYSFLRNKYFNEFMWYEIYDLIEFIPLYYKDAKFSYNSEAVNDDFRKYINSVLERENSAYRFVADIIIAITSDIEIESIEEILNIDSKYQTVKTHIRTSLKHLSDKQNPDFRNSVKESISAVEAVCKIVIGNNKGTLGKALNEIEKKHPIHPSFKDALLKLYGFTSDSDGIRHALMDESKLEYADALFMLINCSAFINYIIYKTSN